MINILSIYHSYYLSIHLWCDSRSSFISPRTFGLFDDDCLGGLRPAAILLSRTLLFFFFLWAFAAIFFTFLLVLISCCFGALLYSGRRFRELLC